MSENIINENYVEQYKVLHNEKDDYGTSSIHCFEEVCMILDYLKPNVVLDYGCGKAILLNKLRETYKNIKFYGYDPSIPELNKLPIEKADFIINTDVLEHIPEEILQNVVKKISDISQYVFFNLHHSKANAVLSNGENAHCTIKDRQWYEELFRKYFGYVNMENGRQDVNSVCFTFFMPKDLKLKYYNIIGRETIEMKIDRILNKKNKMKKLFINFICIFIPIKKVRQKIRKLYL